MWERGRAAGVGPLRGAALDFAAALLHDGSMGRRSAWAAVTVVAALAVPASASAKNVTLEMRTTGLVSVAWHGDPDRGCAAAGLCGYRGSFITRADPNTTVGFGLGPHERTEDIGFFGAADSVVRVRRVESDGTTSACVDGAPGPNPLQLAFARTGGRLSLSLRTEGSVDHRCAGPHLAEPLRGLPRVTIPLPRVGGRPRTVKLASSVPYASGRFSGTVTSDLRVRIRSERPDRGEVDAPFDDVGPPPPGPAPTQRFAELRLRFRIEGFSGAATASFAGRPRPLCVTLDACGATGAVKWAIDGAGGDVLVQGVAPARRSDRGLRGAIAAIRRDGGSEVDGFGEFRRGTLGSVAAEVRRPDGATCSDLSTAQPPALGMGIGRRRLTIALGPRFEFPGGDLFATGCPGPTRLDVLGFRPVAVGSAPSAWLARRELPLTLTRKSAFSTVGYGGTADSRFSLRLRRVSARASYNRGVAR